MGFWVFVLMMNLLIPVTMLVFGYRFIKKAPAEINHVFGYRTAMSMKNKDTWRFAHACCGKLWVRLGWAILLISALASLLVLNKDNNTMGICCAAVTIAQATVMLLSIIPVERALKRNFDQYGRKR